MPVTAYSGTLHECMLSEHMHADTQTSPILLYECPMEITVETAHKFSSIIIMLLHFCQSTVPQYRYVICSFKLSITPYWKFNLVSNMPNILFTGSFLAHWTSEVTEIKTKLAYYFCSQMHDIWASKQKLKWCQLMYKVPLSEFSF